MFVEWTGKRFLACPRKLVSSGRDPYEVRTTLRKAYLTPSEFVSGGNRLIASGSYRFRVRCTERRTRIFSDNRGEQSSLAGFRSVVYFPICLRKDSLVMVLKGPNLL